MTKFLGGDEAHTHLVRGLDLALAQKVRREEMKSAGSRPGEEGGAVSGEIDLDDVMRKASERRGGDRTRILAQSVVGSDPSTALNQLERSVTSTLGRGMISYLWSKLGVDRSYRTRSSAADGREGPTNAGLALQRSTLAFSLRAHVGDTSRSWEIPAEVTLSRGEHDLRVRDSGPAGMGGPFGGRVNPTPLDRNLIERIRGSFAPSSAGGDDRGDGSRRTKKRGGKVHISSQICM